MSQVKRVVIVAEAANILGGAEKVAMDTAICLAGAGYEVTYFAASGPVGDRLKRDRIRVELVRERYRVDELSEKERVLRATSDREAAARFKSLLAQFDPRDTVVHLHSWRFELTSSILEPLFASGLPTLYTAHDYGLACPYVGFYDYRREAICPQRGGSFGCLCTNCNRTSYKHKLWVYYKNSVIPNRLGQRSRFGHYIFVSEFSKRILAPYLAPSAKVHVVQNPIEAVDEGPRPLLVDGPFVFVGRITKEKDPETFARAAKKLGVRAVFVGDGNIVEQVKAANPEAEFLGWRRPPEVRELMRSARALVFPSAWYEGQPLTTQEALSIGLPSIISDACAAQDVIEDGRTGLLFRCGDVDHLAEQMRRLQDDPFNTQVGQAAYDSFWQNPPTAERYLATLTDLYEQAVR